MPRKKKERSESRTRMMSAYHPYHGGQRRWLKLVVTVVLLAVLAFCGLEAAVIIGDHSQVSGEPGVMVILGAKVEASGGPSALLQDRLDTALEYLADHPDLTIVVSGGQGSNEPVSEAQCMRDYLASHGISEDQILMEDQSHNTWQNLNFTFTLLREQGQGGEMGQVLVVSNGFHLTRARMLFGRVWEGTYTLSTLAAPSTDLPAAVKGYLREPLALVKSFVVDR